MKIEALPRNLPGDENPYATIGLFFGKCSNDVLICSVASFFDNSKAFNINPIKQINA